MDSLEREKHIIKEMIEYFEANRGSDNDQMMLNMKFYISKIVKLVAERMGYSTLIVNENEENKSDIENIETQKDDNRLLLVFSKLNIYGQGYFSLNSISDDNERYDTIEIKLSENVIQEILNMKYKAPEKNIERILEIVYHELRHFQQYFMAKSSVSSDIALKWAKENYILRKRNNFYRKNHNSFKIEEDAEMSASKKWTKLTGNIATRKRYTSDLKVNFKNVNEDDYTSMLFDRFINRRNAKIIFENFPIINKEYDNNGKRKRIQLLVLDMKSELEEIDSVDDFTDDDKRTLKEECQGMYYGILYRSMNNSKNKDIFEAADLYDKNNHNRLFTDMQVYFVNRFESEKEDLELFSISDEKDSEIQRRRNVYSLKIENIKDIEIKCQYYEEHDLKKNSEISTSSPIWNEILNTDKVRLRNDLISYRNLKDKDDATRDDSDDER